MADIKTATLDALFSPKSVAIVGASSDQRRFGGRPIQYLLEAGFEGPIYPVNPKRDEIQGVKAYPSVSDIPGPVDCAILAVSAQVTKSVVAECIEKGVKSAVLYGAGFSEMGEEGARLQAEVVEMARGAGMRLLGPNCMGLFNAHSKFYATFASALEEGVPEPGRIAIASQSGGYGGYLLKKLYLKGLGVSQWATTGNEADLDVGEVLGWMAAQPDTDVLLGYIEGVRSSENLIKALEVAKANNKPVIMMKVGRTAEGRKAAASHTASLTGEDSIYDAIFEKYGVYRPRTSEEMLDLAYALSKGKLPKGKRVGVISISGGVGVQIADFVSDEGLEMGQLDDSAKDALRALVPNCSPHNPIDMTGLVTTNHDLMEKTLDVVLASGAFDATLIFLGITGAAPSMAGPLQAAIANAISRKPDQLVFVAVTAPPEAVRGYDEKGIFAFEDPSAAVKALSALYHFEQVSHRAPVRVSSAQSAGISVDWPKDGKFNESDSKALMAKIGVPSPKEILATDSASAAKAAAEIGFPVAVKIVSPDILHKTEYGGVALGLESADDVAASVETMRANVSDKLPDARIDGFLVSEMVVGGVETIVGVHKDEAFGPVVTFGLGGTLVELIKDTACALAPISEADAVDLIKSIKTAPLLTGYRGSAPADIAALARAISQISQFAVDSEAELASIEVNPLVVRDAGKGLVALDAVVQGEPQ